jgi:hypothetical protein
MCFIYFRTSDWRLRLPSETPDRGFCAVGALVFFAVFGIREFS